MDRLFQKKMVGLSVIALLVITALGFALFGRNLGEHWNVIAIALVLVMIIGTVLLFLSDRMTLMSMDAYRALIKENESLTKENRTLSRKARDAVKVSGLSNSLSALLSNMPAMTFSKDAESGRYMACNQLFAEYAGKTTPSQVVGLTDAELFDETTAGHFADDDRTALSMEKPYIFHETVPDAAGNIRYFQTTKLRFTDSSGRNCLLGMCVDVTEMVMVKKESEQNYEAWEKARDESNRNQEAYEKARNESDQHYEAYEKARHESLTYSRIARALASNYTFLYYVNIDDDSFREYSTLGDSGDMEVKRSGEDFFNQSYKDAGEALFEEDREVFREAFTKERLLKHIDDDGAFAINYRLMLDGVPNYVSLKAVRMEDDDSHIIIGVSNIDAQMKEKEAMRRIREDQLTYARIAALSGDFICIYMVDPVTDHYTQFSTSGSYASLPVPREGEDFFGESRERSSSIVHEDDLGYLLEVLTKENVLGRIGESGVFSVEYRLMMDGSYRYVNLRAARIKEGENFQLIVGLLDIDARVRHEQEHARSIQMWKAEGDRLLGVSERAVAASEAKSAFLSNMSHEIRTPINAILGLNEMILRESNDDNILNYSASIRTAGNTLLSLVNDILDFSKIEAGKMEIVPVDYEVSSLLNDLVNMIRTRADEKGLELVTRFDGNIPNLLFGDEIRIKQVITNLLTNAVKYTEKGRVVFDVTYERCIKEPDKVMLKVSVKDSGRGIRDEDMGKLFEEFERIEEDKNRDIEGTGLGMSITRKLLELMDSSLQIKSIYGMGSEFSFSLRQTVVDWEPLGDYETTFKDHLKMMGRYRESFRAPDADILVVDDNQMNLVVFTGLLKQTDVRIDTAGSGSDALLLSRKKKYDVIFLDHMMPEKDGIETLHEMRGEEDNPNLRTPVICLTANAVSGAREQYMAEGFDDYLTKPIYPEKLEEMLLSYIPEEKLLEASDETAIDSNLADFPELEVLRGQMSVDVKAGIENCGGVQSYMQLLKLFYENIDVEAELLEGFISKADLKNYTIKVHGLKSSARLIGALQVGEDAQRLENAGKSGDMSFISAHEGGFIRSLMSVKELLRGVFTVKKESSGTVATRQQMADAMERISRAAYDMDSERLIKVFREMEGYEIPQEDEPVWRELKEAMDRYDYDAMLELCR